MEELIAFAASIQTMWRGACIPDRKYKFQS